jgi:DNA-binding LacI/PurR family transcriptional regulator
MMDSGLPVVTGERFLDADPGPVGVVDADHVGALTELLDHLRAQGATAPALICPRDDTSWTRSLRTGYREWCRSHRAVERLRDISFNANADEVRLVAAALLAEQPAPDAIISAPDGGAIGVVSAASEIGRGVGEDLLVAACVDSLTMQLANPPITALNLRPRLLGNRCVELLVAAVDGDPAPTPSMHQLELVVRASTGALRG